MVRCTKKDRFDGYNDVNWFKETNTLIIFPQKKLLNLEEEKIWKNGNKKQIITF